MPLFLPSDPDKFPTEELKKVVKPSPPKPHPKDTWTQTKPGVWENGLGQKKSDGLTKVEIVPSQITISYSGLTKTRPIAPITIEKWNVWLEGFKGRYPDIVWHFH